MFRSFRALSSVSAVKLAFALLACAAVSATTGCANSFNDFPSPAADTSMGVVSGNVHGGRQPIAGASISVYAAGTSGYGGASKLLSPIPTVTDSGGNFSITSSYTCLPGQQVYLLATGGNPGSGTVNSAVGLMAILGQCPSTGTMASLTPFVIINEASTIAAAYAFAGYATDPTHVSSSGTSQALTGMANAFATAASLESITSSTGGLAVTPSGTGTAPQSNLNALANILAACVNSTGASSSQCSTLFATALSGGATGTAPTNTAAAAINIAHYPGNGVATLFGLTTGIGTPFQPTLTSAPNDYNLIIEYRGGGISYPAALAIDAAGSIWIAQPGPAAIIKMSNAGVILSGAAGFTNSSVYGPESISIDPSGNAWVANYYPAVLELSNSGTFLSGTTGYAGSTYTIGASSIAADPSGDIWVASAQEYGMTRMTSTGSVIFSEYYFPFGGGYILTPTEAFIDASGNGWSSNIKSSNSTGELVKFSGTGTIIPGAASSEIYAGDTTGIAGDQQESIAVDSAGNFWIANPNSTISEFTSGGTLLSGSGYSGGGIKSPKGLAIDGAGNVWVTNGSSYYVTVLSSSGTPLSGTLGYLTPTVTYGALDPAIDSSGNVWITGQFGVAEWVGAATPVVTPLVANLISPYSAPASKP